MNPIIQNFWTPEARARYGIRGLEDFTPAELAVLQAKLAGWMRQRPPHPERTRRRPWVMPPHTAHPA